MDNQVKVGVACFVWRNEKFLIAKRRGSHGEGSWSIPGGHLEFGESWTECATREVLEETGIHIQNVRFVTTTNDLFKTKHYITIWVEADWLSGEPFITEPDKCLEQRWADFATLPQPLFEPCWVNLRAVKPEFFA